jgi:hypothetical protein
MARVVLIGDEARDIYHLGSLRSILSHHPWTRDLSDEYASMCQ